jgi:hypothetical protein
MLQSPCLGKRKNKAPFYRAFSESHFAHSFADFQLPILPWEEFLFVEPCVAVHAVLGEAGPCGESAHGITVRVGVAEEDFERAFIHKDEG